MRTLLVSAACFVAVAPAHAQAATAAPHRCQLEQDDAVRTSCLLQAFPKVAPAQPGASVPPSTVPLVSSADTPAGSVSTAAAQRIDVREQRAERSKGKPTLYLHSSAKVTDFGRLDLGDDGASFNGTRQGGKDYLGVDAGLVLSFPATSNQGWQPYAFAAWSRDVSGADDERKDKRTVGFGTTGVMYQGLGEPRDRMTIPATFTVSRRADVYGTDDAYLAVARLDFIRLDAWSDRGLNRISAIPQAGLLVERRDTGASATTDGTWTTAFVGSQFSYRFWTEGNSRSINATALARWYADVGVPSGNDKRYQRFGQIKLSYSLFDSENEDVKVRPSLFIARQAGKDQISGSDKAKTTYGIQITVN